MDRSIKGFATIISLLSLCAITVGCTAEGAVSIPPPRSESTGTYTMKWAIGNSRDPGLCAMYGADRMELVISDTAGRRVARAYQPCTEMEMTVPLLPGSYVADAVLLDSNNREVSTTLNLLPFNIFSGSDELAITNFPTSSMTRNVLSAPESPSDDDIDEEAE